MWQWTKASCQQLVRNWDSLLSALQGRHFSNGCPEPRHSLQMTAASANFFTATLGRPWVRSTQQDFFLISHAHKLCEDRNVHHCLTLVSSGQLICIAIDIGYSEIWNVLGFHRRDCTYLGGSRKILQHMWKQ